MHDRLAARARRRTTTTRSATTASTPTQARARRRPRPGTAWTTETYDGRRRCGKPGVGLYVDAKPARRRQSDADPDADARLDGADLRRADGRPADSVPDPAGRRSAAATVASRAQRFTLDTGGQPLPLLPVWITKLPPRRSRRVEISEIDAVRAAYAAQKRVRRARRSWRSSAMRDAAGRSSSGYGDARWPPTASRRRSSAVKPGIVLSSLTQHVVAVDEEVDAREAAAADAQERLDGQRAHALARARRRSARARRSSIPPVGYLAS